MRKYELGKVRSLPMVPLLAIVSSSSSRKLQVLHIVYFKIYDYTCMEFKMFTANILAGKVFKGIKASKVNK